MASSPINHNFGVNHLHSVQHLAKQSPVANKEAVAPESHEPKDSTASFSSLAQVESSPVEKAPAKEAAAPVAHKHAAAHVKTHSNSPLTMGDLGEVHGIDLNGPDRLGEAKIEGLNGIFSTKLMGLSGNTLANLNPFGL